MKYPESNLPDFLKLLLAPTRPADPWGSDPEAPEVSETRILRLRRSETDYTAALDRSAARLLERQIELERERREADALCAEILRHSAERQELVLRNDPRFHSWGVLEKLLERSEECLPAGRAEAERLAHLTLCVAGRLDRGYYGASRIEDLRARAWSFIAESRRLRSDFTGAGEAFARAHGHLETGTGDALERALILHLEASLRRCERRFDAAKRLLRRALQIFVEDREDQRLGLSLVNLAIVYRSEGELPTAFALLEEALRRIDEELDPRALLCARHQMIHTLAAAGRLMEARGLLLKSRPLYRRFPDAWTQSHLRRLRGQLALGFAEMAEAEAELLGARQGFVSLESRYEAGLTALDLAALFARQERAAELREAAGSALEVFRDLGLLPEIRAAESFLRQADEIQGAYLEQARAAAAFE